jgi:ribosomal protein S18 acetylase RimI-like enzyme
VAASQTCESLEAGLRRACPALGFRPEEDADRQFLGNLYAEVREAELRLTPWNVQQRRQFTDAQFDLQRQHYRANYAGAEFLIVEQAGERIGRLYVCGYPREIRVMDIALVARCRNGGIGTRIVGALLAIAGEYERDLTLHVEPANPAQRLYGRLGFRLVENRGFYDFLAWSPRSVASS